MSESPTPETPGAPDPDGAHPAAPDETEPDTTAQDAAAPEAEADGTPDRAFIRDNPGKRRFDVFVGEHHAGFSKYRDVDVDGADAPQRIFFHTVVFDEYEGRGLASTLTRTALEQTVREGRRIVAVCPYVARWVEHHEGAAAHVDAVRPEHLAAIEQV